MNQIVQYVMIFGVVGLFFVALYAAGLGELSVRSESQLERLAKYERQMLEQVMVVEVVSASSPAMVDVINIGVTPVQIDRLLANGTVTTAYTTVVWEAGVGHVQTHGLLPVGEVVRISVSGGGVPVFIVTENDRMFTLGGGG